MGTDAHQALHRLSTSELHAFARALDLSWPPQAIVQGVWWPGSDEQRQNYRVTASQSHASLLRSTWIAERAHDVYRVMARPANADEIEELLQALRELDALEQRVDEPIAEAQYDCRHRTYQLCFTALEAMLEGFAYKRWIFRRHADGRPLSVAYICETCDGNAYVTLPGGAVLRGDPWSD